MEALWFWLLTAMLATYVVTAGSDLGVGIVLLRVGRSVDERWQIIRTLRPVWKPNEVWLVAAGGALFMASPTTLATAFSGFYLPLMIVCWLLILRGLAIEFRYQVPDAMWAQLWDVALSISSLLLVVCLGAALGNIVRGVPLDENGSFFEPLWTDFTVGDATGILDWYTVLVGVAAVLALAHHGSLWLNAFTDGDVQHRARRGAGRLWVPELIVMAVVTVASFAVRPAIVDQLGARPWGVIFPAVGAGGLIAAVVFRRRGRERSAYLASCGSLYGLFGTAAVSTFPHMLPARDPQFSLSMYEVAAPESSLRTGLLWFVPGMVLVIAYFAFAYTKMPRKFSLHDDA